jgi:hypothetical protein
MKTLTFMAIFLFCTQLEAQSNGGPRGSGIEMEKETIRDKAAKNPRNRTFSESFGSIDEPREEEERMEVEDVREKLKDDPFIDNYGNGETTNRR